MVQKVDFDNYANEYEKTLEEDLKFFGEDNSYFAEYKIDIVKKKQSALTPAQYLISVAGLVAILKNSKNSSPNQKFPDVIFQLKVLKLQKVKIRT